MSYRIRVPGEDGKPGGWVALLEGIWTLTTNPAMATTWGDQKEALDQRAYDAPQRARLTGIVEESDETVKIPMPFIAGQVVTSLVAGTPPVTRSLGTIEIAPVLMAAMRTIARGRPDQTRPFGGEMARQIMREALTQCGIDW